MKMAAIGLLWFPLAAGQNTTGPNSPSSPPLPSVAKVLEMSRTALAAAGILEQDLDSEILYRLGPTISYAPIRSTLKVAVSGTGKLRIEMGPLLLISDGSAMWTYRADKGEYAREPANPFEIENYRNRIPIEDAFQPASVIRSEPVVVEGKPYDCWLIEAPIISPLSMPESRVRFWMSKENGLLLQFDALTRADAYGLRLPEGMEKPKYFDIQVRQVTRRLKGAKNPALFQFTPPDTAKRVPNIQVPRPWERVM